MAGTVVASVVKNDTTSPPAFQNSAGTEIGRLCRAWVNFAGSTGAIAASFNVSSVTRNSTGIYTVNFTNAMPDTNFAGFYTNGQNAVSNNIGNTLYGQTVSSVTCAHWESNANSDVALNYVAIFR